jgi:glycosyltransferase involved in cell wall biosynthesis
MPTVSAIIPAYNAAPYIEAAVGSALTQEGVDVEVIVVDDGSTDGTWERLRRFGSALHKVRQPNGGPAAARNHGARLARGEWLAFLDADDEWLPTKLATQLGAAGADCGLVYTDRYNVGHCARVNGRQSDGVRLWDGDVFEPLLRDNFITASSVIMRKAWFERLGGFEEQLVGTEDWDLWLRYAALGPVRLCREPLVRYRWHKSSLQSNLDRMCRDRLEVLRRALASPRGRELLWAARHQALAGVWGVSAWFAAETRPRKAAWWYLRSAMCWPWDLQPYKGIVKCCLGRS